MKTKLKMNETMHILHLALIMICKYLNNKLIHHFKFKHLVKRKKGSLFLIYLISLTLIKVDLF